MSLSRRPCRLLWTTGRGSPLRGSAGLRILYQGSDALRHPRPRGAGLVGVTWSPPHGGGCPTSQARPTSSQPATAWHRTPGCRSTRLRRRCPARPTGLPPPGGRRLSLGAASGHPEQEPSRCLGGGTAHERLDCCALTLLARGSSQSAHGRSGERGEGIRCVQHDSSSWEKRKSTSGRGARPSSSAGSIGRQAQWTARPDARCRNAPSRLALVLEVKPARAVCEQSDLSVPRRTPGGSPAGSREESVPHSSRSAEANVDAAGDERSVEGVLHGMQ